MSDPQSSDFIPSSSRYRSLDTNMCKMMLNDLINKTKYQMLAKIQLEWPNCGGSEFCISARPRLSEIWARFVPSGGVLQLLIIAQPLQALV